MKVKMNLWTFGHQKIQISNRMNTNLKVCCRREIRPTSNQSTVFTLLPRLHRWASNGKNGWMR